MKLMVGFFVVVVMAVVGFEEAESTVCAPLSFFKVDGTVCRCSTTGREYVCKELFIQKPSASKGTFRDTDDTYVLYTHPPRPTYVRYSKPHKHNDSDEDDSSDSSSSSSSSSSESNESDNSRENSENFNEIQPRFFKKYRGLCC